MHTLQAGRQGLSQQEQHPPPRLATAKLAICGAVFALGLQAQPFTVSGQFTAVPAGNGHLQVVTGDVNRDGKLDVVTLNTNGTVSVLLGAGNGTFALGPGSPIAGFTNGARIALVDVNLDGKLDLKADFSNGNTGLWNGDGAGGFAIALGGGVGVALTDNAVADFNGDNIQDAVFAGGSVLRVFQGVLSGNNSFLNVGATTNAQSVAVGDFNGDRKIDIAVSSSSASTVAIFLGNGDFTFAANGTVAVPAAGAAAGTLRSGDFNNDGKVDLGLLIGGGRLAILLGNGSGGFSASSASPVTVTVSPVTPSSLELADIDGDGKLDAVVGFTNTSGSGGFSVYRGNGSGGFSLLSGTPLSVNGTSALAAVGDFNNDGRLDVAATESGTPEVLDAKVRIFLNNLDKFFFVPSRLDYYTTAGSTTPINRTSSIFGTGSFLDASNQPWLSAGAGCNASCITVNPTGLAPGRYSGIQRALPAATAHAGSLLASLQVSRASGGMTTQTFTTGTGSTYPAVADFNNDGKPDLAVTNGGSNNVTVLLGNGAGGFSSAPGSPFSVGSNPIGIAAGDFNGDGKADLAVANRNGDAVSILLGLGTGGFGPSPFPTVAVTSPFDVAAIDLNRDGKLDLAVASPSSPW